MPKYEGTYQKCPLCGNPAPAKTVDGRPRFMCGHCYYAIIAELVISRAIEDPISGEERILRMEAAAANTSIGHPEPCDAPKDGRPPLRPEERDVQLRKVFRVLHDAGKPLTGSQVDLRAHIRKGSGRQILARLEKMGVATQLPERRRGKCQWSATLPPIPLEPQPECRTPQAFDEWQTLAQVSRAAATRDRDRKVAELLTEI